MNMKRCVARILGTSLVCFALIAPAFAEEDASRIEISLKKDDIEMKKGVVCMVAPGEKIQVSTVSSDNVTVDKIGFNIDYGAVAEIEGDTLTIIVPEKNDAIKFTLGVAAAGLDENGENVTAGWEYYSLVYDEEVFIHKKIENGATIEACAGEVLRLEAEHADKVQKIYITWDDLKNDSGIDWSQVETSSYDLTIPEEYKAGEEHYLSMVALYNDGKYSARTDYRVIITDEKN